MATLTTGPVWTDHVQDGVTFAVSHLRPVFVDHSIPAIEPTAKKPGRVARVVKLRISYSHHCFTQALGKVPNANPDHYYNCTKRPNDPRVFCPVRWKESFALPGIIAALKNCYFTRHDNYFVWKDPTNPMLDEYFVYFSIALHPSGFVDIEVESSYPRADAERVKKNAKKISFNSLVVNTVNGKRTHAPP